MALIGELRIIDNFKDTSVGIAKDSGMVLTLLSSILRMNFSWLSEALALLSSWRSGSSGLLCCSRSATAQLIIRQRGVANELTSVIAAAVSSTENMDIDVKAHLPPGDNLCTTLSSPQFSQALSMFWSALQSGQAGPVIRQFGLGTEAVTAAANGNLEEFVNALESSKGGQGQTDQGQEDKSKKPSPPGTGSSDKKDEDDEGMCLD